jgi:hypothetical protein
MPELPPSADDSKFVRGKDGWLFLAADINDVLALRDPASGRQPGSIAPRTGKREAGVRCSATP